MSQNHSNKPRTQILDLVDDLSQLSVLSQSDLHLVKGGQIVLGPIMTISEACTCAVGGGNDYDNERIVFM